MIPPLDERGLLPAGIHTASLEAVAHAFCSGQYRELLWQDLIRFLRDHFIAANLHPPLYLAGSFFSDKPNPGDIELTVDLGGRSQEQMLAALALFLERQRWHNEYRVDYYPNMPGNSDFVAFFQYVGPKTAQTKGLNEKDRRGIIKVESWTLG
ncbi:hypothetical protein HQ393_05000 [Chitinibacter bivalviorum]|uniref:Uncharacterized protein n=1 Tax=Chitinibacter bivalviorum TaxID=2739434 RepID=A0A7H9BGY4_9NEIS|nr:hypothetical protein [Chitinibacter bivalviorum]QLG87662.1 hypothetical protein HQ393_05000 [Chitinibacter bivalviorum]